MARYQYLARNADGQLIQGQVEAENSVAAQRQLQREGLSIELIRLLTTTAPSDWAVHKRIPSGSAKLTEPAPNRPPIASPVAFPELARHIAIARQQGHQMAMGLTAYASELPPGALKTESLRLATVLEQPTADAEPLASQSFDATLLPLVDPQIETGGLAALLQGLVEAYGVSDGMWRRAFAAIVYPGIVMLLGVGLLALFSFSIAPPFQQLFGDFQTELPALTRLVMGVSGFIRRHLLIVVLLPAIVVGVLGALGRVSVRNRFLESLPLLGRSVREYRLGRLSGRLARLLNANLSAGTALRLAAQELPRGRIHSETLELAEECECEAGAPSTTCHGLLPEMIRHVCLTPIENQVRARMLSRLSATYLAQSRRRWSWLISAVEPLVIVLVGLLVGFNVLALMLPLISLITNLS